jgi:hypothetical protein
MTIFEFLNDFQLPGWIWAALFGYWVIKK